MKNIIISGALLLCCLSFIDVKAQGIHFCDTYEEARKLATQQGKLLFVDFYTVWCGPCKLLAKNVFTREDVGAYFNRHFVCCKLDAEKEGKELAKKYKVSSYPTLIFLDSQGEAVHKTGNHSAEGLIAEAGKALEWRDSPENLTNLTNQYTSGEKEEHFLKNYIERLTKAKLSPAQPIEDYLGVQTAMQEDSKEMLDFLMDNSQHLRLGGNAWRIIGQNMEAYLNLPISDMKKQIVECLPDRLIENTREAALENKDAGLYRLFLEYREKRGHGLNDVPVKEFQMELLLLEGKTKEYKKAMVAYLDSIVDSHKVKEFRKKNICEPHPAADQAKTEKQLTAEEAAQERMAKSQVKKVIRLATPFLYVADNKSEAKAFGRWVDYAKALLPDHFAVLNFEASVSYRFGDQPAAVESKRKALSNVPSYSKARYWIADELKQMEENAFSEGRVILP